MQIEGGKGAMDYVKLEAALLRWQEAYRKIAALDTARAFGLQKAAPATQAEVLAAEQALGMPMPPGIREFFLRCSGRLAFFASLDDAFCDALPGALRGIFCASLFLSVEGILASEKSRRGWVEACFSDPADAYDKVWQDKLGFLSVANGDVIAFDLRDGQTEHSVVYLSHDGGEGHGCVLGRSFEAFLESYVAIGLCGEEDWQMLPFIVDAKAGLCPDCENAVLYRTLVFGAGTR